MTPVLIVLNAARRASSSRSSTCRTARSRGSSSRVSTKDWGDRRTSSSRTRTEQVLDEMSWSSGDRFGHEEALMHLVSWLREHQEGRKLVGHRASGRPWRRGLFRPGAGRRLVVQALEALVPLAPLHQPHNLEPIRIVRRRLPGMPQVACFDTAFHQSPVRHREMFALPTRDARARRAALRLSRALLRLHRVRSADYDPGLAKGRVIVAHLGNGASLCALKEGASVATTMGFSALDGLPMGTRCGAIDAGVVFYMLREMKLSPEEAERVLYTKSGLLGVSGLSNDMRVLRAECGDECGCQAGHRSVRLSHHARDRIARRGARRARRARLHGRDRRERRGDPRRGDRRPRLGRTEPRRGRQPRRRATNLHGSGPTAWVIPTNEELVIARQMQSVLGATQARLAS